MENITLGEVLIALTFVLALIGNVKNLIKEIKNPIDKKLEKVLEPVKKEIADFKEEYKKSELDSAETDLVNFMYFVEKNMASPEQIQNGYKLFDKYSKLGGNSYVHSKWEKLRKEGKI